MKYHVVYNYNKLGVDGVEHYQSLGWFTVKMLQQVLLASDKGAKKFASVLNRQRESDGATVNLCVLC